MNLARLCIIVVLFGVGLCGALSAQQITRDPRYPAYWFAPVIDPQKPDWEILPQQAAAGEVILSKRNELGLLSNFAATPFVFHGQRYASLEGFWQMMKYPENDADLRAKFPGLEWRHTREQVAQLTAFDAKRAGDPVRTSGFRFSTNNFRMRLYSSAQLSSRSKPWSSTG